MAKLKARGRTELLRMSKSDNVIDPKSTIVWQRWTRAYLSDGNILEKYDIRFKPNTHGSSGEFHSYGWKRKGKLVKGLSLQTIATEYGKKEWVIELMELSEHNEMGVVTNNHKASVSL